MDETKNEIIETSKTIVEEKDEASEEKPSECANEPAPKEKKRLPKAVKILLPVIGALLIALFAAAIAYAMLPHESEIGEPISLRTDSLPWLYTADTSGIDVEKLGSHDITVKIFGAVPLKAKLSVVDTKAPEVSVHSITVPHGYTPSPLSFVESAFDKTHISYSLQLTISEENSITGILLATDEGGNISEIPVKYTHDAKLQSYTSELGELIEDIEYYVRTKNKLDELDLSSVNAEACGVYPVSSIKNGEICVFDIIIADTSAPSAVVRSLDIIKGDTVELADFVTASYDASEITSRFLTEPDTNTVGIQTLTLEFEDTSGNITQKEAFLHVHDIKDGITIEAGTTTAQFGMLVFEMDDELALSSGTNIKNLDVGTHEIGLAGTYSTLPFKIIIEDTTAPELKLIPLTVYPGYTPEIKDFVESCTDASDHTLEYTIAPTVDIEGTFVVVIKATDEHGNSASASTTVTVIADTIAPMIYGVRDIKAYEGDTVSYRSGVYAFDERDGRVTVRVNSPKVNTSTPGTYTVTYTASDSEGNTAVATARVTIMSVTGAVVNEYADSVLSQITTPYMNDMEKARAIFDWCRENIKYSTVTSHLMGYYTKAAYSGFTKHYGNCYTYYAVSAALLSRAGIANIQIQRDSVSNPHYWNLVYMNGGWYHFDTCPQPAGHKAEVFMWTDSQIRSFTLDYYYSFNRSKYPATI